MSTLIAIDTATEACSVALWRDGEIIGEQFEVAPRRHTELLLPMIDGLLRKAQLTLAELDAVAFGQGPGSFMGLRLATSVAQGLAYAAAIPVIPISSLCALAQAGYQQSGQSTIIAAWDARMQQVYWGIYQANEQGLMELMGDEQVADPAAVSIGQSISIGAVGNAWTVYAEQFSANLMNKLTIIPNQYPSANALAKLAAVQLEQQQLIDPRQAEPSYIRNQVASKPKGVK